MNEIKVFENEKFGRIRGIEIDGESWLVGKDIAERLGYTNPSKALNDHVDNEDKLKNESLSSLGQRGGWLINESGFYSLVLSSKLPTAKAFKRWVTSEVLPTIRKTGGYVNNDELFINTYLKDTDEATKQIFRSTLMVLRQKNELIEEMQPKVSYYDKILQSKSAVSVTQIAKDYGMSAVKFNSTLHDLGVQYKQGDMWVLYQKYTGKGYTKSRTYVVSEDVSRMGTYWTQNGRKFLYDLLKKNGILPECETT